MSFDATRESVSRIVFGQFVLMLVPVAFFFLMRGVHAGFSAIAGGIASWFPTLIFARLTFSRLRSGYSFLAVFIAGELFRLLASAVLFVVVIMFVTNDVLSAGAGFVAAMVALWVASLLLFARQPEREASHP